MKVLLIMLSLSLCALSAEEPVQVQSVHTIGTVYPRNRSIVGSVVSGRIDKVFVDIGDHVQEGQALVVLDKKLFDIAVAEAEAAVRLAHVDVKDAERNYERMKHLFEHPRGPSPVISQKKLEDSETRLEQAVVQCSRAEEALNRAVQQRAETTIVAPFDGVITKRMVHPGESVSATPVTKLLEVISDQNTFVEFAVPQIYRHKVRVGTCITLSIEGRDDLSIPIDTIFPDIDEKTRSMKCRASLRSSAILPGSLVRIVVPLEGL